MAPLLVEFVILPEADPRKSSRGLWPSHSEQGKFQKGALKSKYICSETSYSGHSEQR